MKREDIEAFQERITPYLERQGDKKELEDVCQMAVAFADAIERNVYMEGGNMNEQVCQSCGMNMKSSEDFGTNADKTPNPEYCKFCRQNGTFTRDMTMEEMLESNLKYLDHWNEETGNSYTVDEARPLLREFLSTLKRWK